MGVGSIALLERKSVNAQAEFGVPHGAKAWELGKMGVNSKFRRSGIGTLLWKVMFEKFEEAAKPDDILYLESGERLTVAAAFYAKCGFERDESFSGTLTPDASHARAEVRMVYRGPRNHDLKEDR